MAEMTVETETKDGDPMIRFSGEIGRGDTEPFRNIMEEKGDQCKHKLFLNLSGLHSIDSMGLGILIYNYSFLKNSGRELIIVDPSDEMRELLEISCLDKLITVD